MAQTKYSAKKDIYPGGAIRNSRDGKGRFDLIPPGPLQRLANLYEVGAKAHGVNNWRGGMPTSRLIDSAMRHINQWRGNEETGKPQDEDHLIQAIWNLMAIVHFEMTGREELNDLRPKSPTK